MPAPLRSFSVRIGVKGRVGPSAGRERGTSGCARSLSTDDTETLCPPIIILRVGASRHSRKKPGEDALMRGGGLGWTARSEFCETWYHEFEGEKSRGIMILPGTSDLSIQTITVQIRELVWVVRKTEKRV